MIKPIKVTLVSDAEARLRRFLRDKLTALETGLKEIHSDKLLMWRKTYEAAPAQKVREFPWHGASNLVVPLAAIHSDTLQARVMAAVFKTSPIWTSKVVGDVQNGNELKRAFEEDLAYRAIEPNELDLYRVYHEWTGEIIRLGTSTIKCPIEKQLEDVAIAGDGISRTTYYTETKYHGSRPEKLPFNRFGIAPDAKTVERANFKYHRIPYQRDRLEELAFNDVYDKDAVKEILGKPDRTSPENVSQEQQQDAGAKIVSGYGFAEYDVYECHIKYKLGRHYTKLIVWYNKLNDKILRCFHFYYPEEIFITGRMFFRDDFFFGYGFCETLGMLQEEVSQIHNQRRDNSTVANTMMWRVDPDSEMNKGYRVLPGGTLPGRKDEIEGIQPGQVNPMTIDEERLTLELAEKRSGVSAPIQGMGGGAMNKRGVYSSMGTLSLLQEGNTRTDLNVTDFRYAHSKLGRVVAHQEAEFFSDDSSRYKRYGKMGTLVQQAYQMYKDGVITLPVYAASASVNREVEKQSDAMVIGIMMKHHGMIMQLLQAASNQFTPPELKKYALAACDSSAMLMQTALRHFNYDEVERFVPNPAQQAGGEPSTPPQLPERPGLTPPGGSGGSPSGPEQAMAAMLTQGVKPQ